MRGHSYTEIFCLYIIQGALSDEGFKIGTLIATQVLDSADLWSENKEILSIFATSLINDLSSALEQDNCKNMTAKRRQYGEDTITSEHFKSI